jgi:multidrug resistance efflux pump
MATALKPPGPQAEKPSGPAAVEAPAAIKADLPRPVSELRRPGAGLEQLLKVEAEMRHATTAAELTFITTNETARLVRARQGFLVRIRGRRCKLTNISGVSDITRESPRVVWIEGLCRNLARQAGLAERRAFVLPAYCDPKDEEHQRYPFHDMVWVPLRLADGHVFAGLLLAREMPWIEPDLVIAQRLAETSAHAWGALTGRRRLKRSISIPRSLWLLGVAAIIAAGFIPVPLTVLAPFEIVPVSPRIVAAPVDGVVERIAVSPNSAVTQGQLLFAMNDTTWRNELDVAQQEVLVAEARLKQVTQGSIDDPKARREMGVAKAELDLKSAQRDYAQDLLNRSVVTAPAAGLVIFSDRKDWEGRPVSIGQRIMQIADPDTVEMQVTIPLADAVAVEQGAPIRAYFDFDPLTPLGAEIRLASFEARNVEGVGLAYRVYATIRPGQAFQPRLGLRGTARVAGKDVPLAYYLFRKPVSAVRQWLGR